MDGFLQFCIDHRSVLCSWGSHPPFLAILSKSLGQLPTLGPKYGAWDSVTRGRGPVGGRGSQKDGPVGGLDLALAKEWEGVRTMCQVLLQRHGLMRKWPCLFWSAFGVLHVNKLGSPAGMWVWKGGGGECWGQQTGSRLDSLNPEACCS